MTGQWVLVDGYSVIHNWLQLRLLMGNSLDHQRQALIHVLRQFADHSGRRVTVVFDGYAAKHKPDGALPAAGVEIIFSSSGKTADDVIERLVGQAAHPDQIVVVTSDNQERRTVETLGAVSQSSELFEQEVQRELLSRLREELES